MKQQYVIKIHADTSEIDAAIIKAKELQKIITDIDIENSQSLAIKVLKEIAEDVLKKAPDRIEACRVLLGQRS